MKILIVEDNGAQRNRLKRMLEVLFPGANITASSGLDIREHLARAEMFDLVTMDGHLPGEYGPALVRKLRDNGCRGMIIMVTTDSDVADEGKEAGANFECLKSDLDDLPRMLDQVGLTGSYAAALRLAALPKSEKP